MNTLEGFVRQEKVLLFLLFVTFLNPFLYGYRVGLLFVLYIFFNFRNTYRSIDRNAILLFIFSVSYEFVAIITSNTNETSVIEIIPNLFLPPTMYIIGRYIGSRYKSVDVLAFVLVFLSFSFSIVPIISIFKHITDTGFYSGGRNLSLIWNTGLDITATGLGTYFTFNMAAVGLITTSRKSRIQKWVFRLTILLFILSLMCVVRLGNRTQLFVAVFCFLASYCLNLRRETLFKSLVGLAIAVVVGASVYLSSSASGYMTFYEDRMDSREHGIETAGGRFERWGKSFEAIVTDPFGWELDRFGYSHNIWLDVARSSGIIPLLFLLFFTASAVRGATSILTNRFRATFVGTYLLSVFMSILLVFFVEPVIDGSYLLFLISCLYIGLMLSFKHSKAFSHQGANKSKIKGETL